MEWCKMRTIFDELMDNWASRHTNTLPTTTATTFPFIQFVPQMSAPPQQQSTSQQSFITISAQQQCNGGGPIRARRQNVRQPLRQNNGCFICRSTVCNKLFYVFYLPAN